jgi:hypothetical protein
VNGNSEPDEPPAEEPTDESDGDVEEETPRMIWGQATHYAGIVDRDNPGHFRSVPKGDDK